MPTILPIGASITILLNAFKYGISFSKYNNLKGYYYVCNQKELKFNNSPEGVPNFLQIRIALLTPNVLKVISKDFDKQNFKKWKTWTNEITMSGQQGTGMYLYDIGNEAGTHEIIVQSRDKIVVRVIDKGKANWSKAMDNEPSSQTWIRINNKDPMLATLKKMLS